MAQQSLTLQEAVATGLEKNLNIQIVSKAVDQTTNDYDIAHQQYTYILDDDLKLRVRWSGDDWPVDLFLKDLRTVMSI